MIGEGDSTNIVGFIEEFQEGDKIYIVMEYCETNLKSVLFKFGRLEENYVKKLLF
jgi:serine/threonine protein kinase